MKLKLVVDVASNFVPIRDWFSKFGIPAHIHMDGGKEFINTPVLQNINPSAI
jgi:hypothetical protein